MTGKLRVADDLSLPAEAVTQTFCFLAKRGAGKTYTASVLAEEMLKAELPICVIDPTGVWWGLRASADGKADGLPIIVMGGEHGDVPLEVTAGELIARFIIEENVSVVLDLQMMRKGEQIRFMTPFAETLYHLNRSPRHIFWDECDAHIPQKPMKDQLRLLGASEDIVRRGRAKGLGVSLISQRAAVINKDVLTQTEVLVALRTVGPQDIAAVRAWVEQHDVHDQADEMLASLPSLPIGESWWWSPGWLNLFKRVHVRARETFNSSRTPKVGEHVKPPKRLAPVDLAALTARMAATIERAKADDPNALRARIAELEKAVIYAKAKPDPMRVERAREAWEKESARAVVAEQRRWVKFEATMRDAMRRVTDLLARAHTVLRELDEAPTPDSLMPVSETIATIRDQIKHVPAARGARDEAAMASWQTKHRNGDVGTTLGKGERAILSLLAEQGAPVTREHLTVATGYKRSSRDTYLQRLRAAGLVDTQGDGFVLTEDGVAAIAPHAVTLPRGPALLAHYLETLSTGEAETLGIIAEAHPGPVERDVISERTGYQRSSRDTYLQRLRARRLIDTAGRGAVRLSDSLAAEIER